MSGYMIIFFINCSNVFHCRHNCIMFVEINSVLLCCDHIIFNKTFNLVYLFTTSQWNHQTFRFYNYHHKAFLIFPSMICLPQSPELQFLVTFKRRVYPYEIISFWNLLLFEPFRTEVSEFWFNKLSVPS